MVFDWGYPPEWLPLVEHLHAAGLDAWWFDGDREAARATFIARRTVSVQALDIQMAKIAKWQPKLDAFYGSRIVRAIGSDHSFTELSSIAGQLLGGKDAIDD